MRYKQFIREIEQQVPAPAYWFAGEDDSMKQLALRHLRYRYEELSPTCTLLEIDAFSADGRTIVEQACQLTLDRGARILQVESADQLGADTHEPLLAYLNSPVPHTCLVFLTSKKKSSPLREVLSKRGALVEFPVARERDAVDLVYGWARNEGKKIGSGAAQLLCRRVGTNAQLLQSEIQKLALYVHPGEIIRPDDVEQMCGETAAVSIFRLTDAFKRKDLSECLRLLARILEDGGSPQYVETMLARELRILLLLQEAGPASTPGEACPYIFGRRKDYTGFYVRQAKNYLRAAQRFQQSSLIRCYQSLARADQVLKSTSSDPFVLLQSALVIAFA